MNGSAYRLVFIEYYLINLVYRYSRPGNDGQVQMADIVFLLAYCLSIIAITDMTLKHARILIIAIGILLPYLSRLPGGSAWLSQYLDTDVGGFLFLAAFNAIAWGSLLAISFIYRFLLSLLVPCLTGFGFLAWSHYTLDLSSDAQASLALMFIPIFTLLPIAIGAVVGYLIDIYLRKRYSKRSETLS